MKIRALNPGAAMGVERLDRLAAAAARDLGAHGVVVTGIREGDVTVVAVAGMTRLHAIQLLPALRAYESGLGAGVDSRETRANATAEVPLVGMGQATSALARAEGRVVGGVHIMCSHRLRGSRESLLRAYVAHFAVGIAASLCVRLS